MKAENYFCSLLNSKGLFYFYDDQNGYDFRIGTKPENCTIKVEIKSCSISKRHGEMKSKDIPYYRSGEFIFRKDQIENNEADYYCFILRWRGEFIMMGLVGQALLKKKLHVSIHTIHALNPLRLEEFINKLK